jgi:mxaJ protein
MCSASLRLAALTAVLLLAGPATARELRVCADPNNLPFSNDRLEGFENKIVAVVAHELGAVPTYTWWAQRRGFIRNTLKSGACDLVPGTPSRMEMLRTTAPYYRSSYVFVTRADAPVIRSLDDPMLRELKIGVQLIGDDGSNTPPAHALAQRGITQNVRGYSVYGDYREESPPARIIAAVARGEIDAAIVWGPLAGYFAHRQPVPLRLAAVEPQTDAGLPMAFDIAMGVRKEDSALHDQIDTALVHRRAEINAILRDYRVPLVDRPALQQGAAR